MTGPEEAVWTPEVVKARLKEAADVIRRLPPPQLSRGYPKRSLPEPVNNSWGAEYEIVDPVAGEWRHRETVLRQAAPRGEEIDRAWASAEWLGYLSERDQKIVWAWANGVSWWKIVQRQRAADRTVRNWFNDAVKRIARGLNKGGAG